MKVLETRTNELGFKRRRYESAGGVRYTTIEVPYDLWKQVNGQGRNQDRAAAVARKLQRQSMAMQAKGLVASGKSAREVARLLGCSANSVSRWAKA